MSIEVNSTMTVRRTIAVAQVIPQYRHTEGQGKRRLLTPDEVLRLPNEELLCIIRGCNVLKLKKMDYTKHPMVKQIQKTSIMNYRPTYVLSCMNSSVSAPVPQPEQASATGNSEQTESETEKDESNTIAGIPVVHLILFGGGMLIAVGGLIGLYFVKKRQEAAESQQDYDDEDDE